ncbi:DUF5052 family protein [Paenibacillus contaminans]|uniref:DUF5052 domain-containing protein n=1 Tax=Paenibacillus contaminans TaxID=450362 RepID=A0A329MCS2_9BACL|nr:DUF5052 family protein [Paenibacillus contaminans]RAV17855.1 DUF5052 domain-containing protein [Paenibacillus contaminans]
MKKIMIAIVCVTVALTLSGCNWFSNEAGKFKSALKGREAIIQTYDEDSNIIDRIEGKSIDIGANKSFEIKDSSGETVSKSGVMSLTVGGKTMMHVGSSLILAEKGLTNVFEEYAKTNDITSHDRSVPFVNRMVNGVKNLTTGQKLLILIRSQTGKPLATFAGKDVSYFTTDIDKSTGFIIDGKYLFVYRCDYTVYDLALLDK